VDTIKFEQERLRIEEEKNALEEYKKAQEEFFEKEQNDRKRKELVKYTFLLRSSKTLLQKIH